MGAAEQRARRLRAMVWAHGERGGGRAGKPGRQLARGRERGRRDGRQAGQTWVEECSCDDCGGPMQRSVSWAAAPAQSTGQRPIKAFKTTAVAAEQTLYRLGPIQNTKAKKGKEKKNTSRGAGSRSRICALMDCRCRPPQGARSTCTNNYGLSVGLRLHEQSQRAQSPGAS